MPDATRKEILAQAPARYGHAAGRHRSRPAVDDQPLAHGVEAVGDTLLPEPTSRNANEIAAMAVLLGQASGRDGVFLRWPAQTEVGRGDRADPAPDLDLAAQARRRWLDNATWPRSGTRSWRFWTRGAA